jgi:hypothetical protein
MLEVSRGYVEIAALLASSMKFWKKKLLNQYKKCRKIERVNVGMP